MRFFLVAFSCSCLALGCDTGLVTLIPAGQSGAPVERLIIYYTVADETLAPYAEERYRELLSAGEIPEATELLLFAEIAGTPSARLHLRSSGGSKELSREEVGLPEGSGVEGRVLGALLAYATAHAPEAETHLIVSGRSSFDEHRGVAGNKNGVLKVGELAEAAEEGRLESITLESSYGGAFSLLFDLRSSARRIIASPGPFSLRGISSEALLTKLHDGGSLEEAVIDAFAASHRISPGAALASFDTSLLEESGNALEELLSLLEEELADPLERVTLRDLLFDPSPYQQGPGALFISLGELGRTVGNRYPEAAEAVASVDLALQELCVTGWSAGDELVTPSLYFVSLDATGAPEGHAGCYLPERPGTEAGEFVRSSRWAPRLMEERGILYLLWYDLLPTGGVR